MTWLKDHDVPPTCPTCGMTGEWNLCDGILGALDLDLEEQKAKPSPMGFLVLSCKHCMHSRFFAAGPILGGSLSGQDISPYSRSRLLQLSPDKSAFLR